MTKTLTATVKSSKEIGVFEGYLSTYDLDRENDIFVKGCWDENIKQLKETKGTARVPLLYQHRADQIIGYADLDLDEKGLKAKGKLYIDDSEKAKTIYKALTDKSLNEMSVGFNATDYKLRDEKNGYEFLKTQVTEASVVFNPANPEAVISDVKEITEIDTQKFFKSKEFEEQVVKILISKGLLNELPTTNEEPMTIDSEKELTNTEKIKKILKEL